MKKSKFDAIEVNLAISNQLAAYFAYFSGEYNKIPLYRQQEIGKIRALLGQLKSEKNRIKTYKEFFDAYDEIIRDLQLKNALFEWWLPSRFKRHLLLGRAFIQMRLRAKLKQRCPECFDDDDVEGTTGVTLRQLHESLRDKCQTFEETVEQHKAVIEGLREQYGHDAVNDVQMLVIRARNLKRAKQLDDSVASAAFGTDASGEEYSEDEVNDQEEGAGDIPMKGLKK